MGKPKLIAVEENSIFPKKDCRKYEEKRYSLD
jgi:hypothetical protein